MCYCSFSKLYFKKIWPENSIESVQLVVIVIALRTSFSSTTAILWPAISTWKFFSDGKAKICYYCGFKIVQDIHVHRGRGGEEPGYPWNCFGSPHYRPHPPHPHTRPWHQNPPSNKIVVLHGLLNPPPPPTICSCISTRFQISTRVHVIRSTTISNRNLNGFEML